MATTLSRARALLRNTSGSVYHPTNSQTALARSTSACKLQPEAGRTCTVQRNFSRAQPPKRLLQYNELRHDRQQVNKVSPSGQASVIYLFLLVAPRSFSVWQNSIILGPIRIQNGQCYQGCNSTTNDRQLNILRCKYLDTMII